MRIFTREWNNNNIESDVRLFQYNYWSRQNSSMNIAILEKRLIHNAGIKDWKPTIHYILDLEACYDR